MIMRRKQTMKTKLSERKIFNVVWESNVKNEFYVYVYPCDTLEVARERVKYFKNEVLSNGHFLYVDSTDCTIEENENRYFIKDNYADYFEDIYINEHKLYVESE